ncbi:MAG: response regulator [Myxococcota bacterium]
MRPRVRRKCQRRNGLRALELVASHDRRIDLVITDVIMPKLDGIETVRRLQVIHLDIRVLFTSGYTPATPPEVARIVRESSLLEKPFGPRELIAAVWSVLKGERPDGPPGDGCAG